MSLFTKKKPVPHTAFERGTVENVSKSTSYGFVTSGLSLDDIDNNNFPDK